MSERTIPALPRWRLPAVAGLLCFLLLLLLWRLLMLQVVDTERGYEFLQGQGDARAIRTEVIPAHRGQIVDRNGEPLAISTPVVSIWANPSEAEAGRQQWPELARKLGLPLDALENKLAYQGRHFVYLRRHLPPPEAEAALAMKVPGIYSQREYRRFYPAGEVTAHLLGFTDIDDRGQEGMELAYEQSLSGVPGKKRVLKELTGKIIREIDAPQPARPGKDLVLSIDLRLQYLAYRELRQSLQDMGASSGSVVMLDCHTGEVLAMANQPSFNPNNRSQVKLSSLRNRAMIDLMEPGSTVKPFTMVAAFESGRYTPLTPVDASPGYIVVDGKTLKDPVNFGLINITKIITKSSQIGMTKVALTLDEKSVVEVFRRFGLGDSSNTGFPGEQAGQLPERNHWSDIERANFAFGYGLLISPLQLARAYSVFASGGLLEPVTLLRRDDEPKGERVIAAGTAQEVVDMLKTVVGPGGTGTRAKIPAYSVAGKTGTAHKVGAHGYEDRYHSLFVGFAPASNPRIVTVVVVDDASMGKYHGGDVAAPVFAKVVGGAMRLMSVAPDDLPAPQPQALVQGVQATAPSAPPTPHKGPV